MPLNEKVLGEFSEAIKRKLKAKKVAAKKKPRKVSRDEVDEIVQQYIEQHRALGELQTLLNNAFSDLLEQFVPSAVPIVSQIDDLACKLQNFAMENKESLLAHTDTKTADLGQILIRFIKNPDKVALESGVDEAEAIAELRSNGLGRFVRLMEEMKRQELRDNWESIEEKGISTLRLMKGKERVVIEVKASKVADLRKLATTGV